MNKILLTILKINPSPLSLTFTFQLIPNLLIHMTLLLNLYLLMTRYLSHHMVLLFLFCMLLTLLLPPQMLYHHLHLLENLNIPINLSLIYKIIYAILLQLIGVILLLMILCPSTPRIILLSNLYRRSLPPIKRLPLMKHRSLPCNPNFKPLSKIIHGT